MKSADGKIVLLTCFTRIFLLTYCTCIYLDTTSTLSAYKLYVTDIPLP
jgi:hypothetical protein